jgi:2-phospho-L-lactate guanylyltransferase
MGTAAILPVKRFGAAKQRLASALGSGTRLALASAMFADVLGALERSKAIAAIVVVSGEPRVQDLATERDLILVGDLQDKGQSYAARCGLARAAALGCGRAVLVPGDCPLLDPGELDELVRSASADVVIVPDHHRTGTNALVINPSGPFEPQFGSDSLKRHVDQAERKQLSYSVEPVASLGIDVDTAEDLSTLIERLEATHGRAPRTLGVMRQIQRSGLAHKVAA